MRCLVHLEERDQEPPKLVRTSARYWFKVSVFVFGGQALWEDVEETWLLAQELENHAWMLKKIRLHHTTQTILRQVSLESAEINSSTAKRPYTNSLPIDRVSCSNADHLVVGSETPWPSPLSLDFFHEMPSRNPSVIRIHRFLVCSSCPFRRRHVCLHASCFVPSEKGKRKSNSTSCPRVGETRLPSNNQTKCTHNSNIYMHTAPM